MSASLGPSWNIHSNSSPRCFTAYAVECLPPSSQQQHPPPPSRGGVGGHRGSAGVGRDADAHRHNPPHQHRRHHHHHRGGSGSASEGGVKNPFRSGGGGGANPFDADDDADHAPVTDSASFGGGGGGSDDPAGEGGGGRRRGGGGAPKPFYVHCAAFGTERGSLHHRAYPASAADPSDDTPSLPAVSSGGDHHHHGGGGGSGAGLMGRVYDRSSRDPSRVVVSPMGVSGEGGGGGGAGGSSSSMAGGSSVASAGGKYQYGGSGGGAPTGPIDLPQGALPGSVVGIVRARPGARAGVGGGGEATQTPDEAVTTTMTSSGIYNNPVFLLLVDDNRGSAGASSPDPGAYAAHLVHARHGSFAKLPPAPPAMIANDPHPHPRDEGGSGGGGEGNDRADGGGGGGGGGSLIGWLGRGESGGGALARSPPHRPSSSLNPSSSASSSGPSPPVPPHPSSLKILPRMSCAAYHPACGFVYAAGTGVHGLPASAVRAVATGLTSTATSGGGVGSRSQNHHHHHRRHHHALPPSSPKSQHHPLPTALFLRCRNALPAPGVRSSGGSSSGAMALACGGRVAIVAVANAFYAVPATLDVGGGGGVARDAGNAIAIKLLAFAQSSQVHPVIAVEVASVSERAATPASASLSPSPPAVVSALVFLASGRECAAVEITSMPDSRATSSGGTVSARRGGGGGDEGGGGGSSSSLLLVSTTVRCEPPRRGVATLPSPVLAAASLPSLLGRRSSYPHPSGNPGFGAGGRGGISSDGSSVASGPLVALLAADGMVHIRSPFCPAVPLTSIEVGTRPNDFFSLCALPMLPAASASLSTSSSRKIVATSYGGEARLVSIRPETSQDFADRLMKLSIDAFGPNGFPRLELAEAMGSTFSAASYAGTEPNPHNRALLRQYLEAVLALADDVATFCGGGENDEHLPAAAEDIITSSSEPLISPNALLAGTAIYCLVCFQSNPPGASSANRASKACASKVGVVGPGHPAVARSAAAVCELVADRLLKEASAPPFSLLQSSPSSIGSVHRHRSSSQGAGGGSHMEFVESAVWLLRSCGCHEKAILALQERMNNPALRNASVGRGGGVDSAQSLSSAGGWSQIKFDSYIATHLGELWSSREDQCRGLVLRSDATRDMLARNPTLGLSVFSTPHPQNENEWRRLDPADDPLAHPLFPSKVLEVLKSVSPRTGPSDFVGGIEESKTLTNDSPGIIPQFSQSYRSGEQVESAPLPLCSGRALAVTYLESAVGISTGKPPSQGPARESGAPRHRGDETDERKADMHDELSLLLLEGIISERSDGDDGEDSDLGAIYRYKLRRLLSWPNANIRSERLLASLPSSFLREHALLLGRIGRHEDALRIFYSDLNSLELALEYCDARHERQHDRTEEEKTCGTVAMGGLDTPIKCAYLPLVRVALNSDQDSDRGIAAAIQVLALRRDSIDKGAALRLLPKNVPLSSVARPFLIPAVVENESQVRRLTVAESLLRAKYVDLKRKLTEAQLKAQSSLHGVPAIQRLNLGDPLQSSKAFKARPAHATSLSFPDVLIVKHFFPRHLVIQAQVGNIAAGPDGRTLADVAFVVAESSDEAISPSMEVPLRTLPPKSTGSAWCVLTASPQRLDGTAFLTCELRYTVLAVDAATGAPLIFSGSASAPGIGRTYVEELQDIEVRHTEFNP